MRRYIGALLLIVSLVAVAYADDPGSRDSLIIGAITIDSYVPSAMLPVYIVTDDDVNNIVMPLTWTSSDSEIHIAGAYFFTTLLGWQEATYEVDVDANHIIIHGAAGDSEPFLNTGYTRQLAMMLRVVIREDAAGQIVPITNYNDYNWGQFVFYLESGEDLIPAIVPGEIRYQSPIVGIDPLVNLPTEFNLSQNYPNPFNMDTQIDLALPNPGEISLRIYDILGREIKTLVSGSLNAGYHSFVWNGNDNSGESVSSGMYFYRLKSNDIDVTKKMVLLK